MLKQRRTAKLSYRIQCDICKTEETIFSEGRAGSDEEAMQKLFGRWEQIERSYSEISRVGRVTRFEKKHRCPKCIAAGIPIPERRTSSHV